MASSKSFRDSRWGMRWRAYRGWPKSRRGLVLEAYCLLGLCRFLIRYVPFRLTAARWLGWFMAETVRSLPPTAAATAADVGWIVERLADHTPWESACLPQAMAAQHMLKRRGIGSTLYLGLARSDRRPTGHEAHAWLRCGEVVVTGEGEMGDFQSVACYAQDALGVYREPNWLKWLTRIWVDPAMHRGSRPYLTPEREIS